jgi:hypothetical protein
MLEGLIRSGADVNRENSVHEAPLHLAAARGHEAVVRLLLRSGALVDCRNRQLETPLLIATRLGHVGVVRELLARGASVNTEDEFGETALAVASASEDPVLRTVVQEADTVGGCPFGSGRMILRRVELQYQENVKSALDRERRLKGQATGLQYAPEASCNRPPLRPHEAQLERLRADVGRLQVPMLHWGCAEVAEFALRTLACEVDRTALAGGSSLALPPEALSWELELGPRFQAEPAATTDQQASLPELSDAVLRQRVARTEPSLWTSEDAHSSPVVVGANVSPLKALQASLARQAEPLSEWSTLEPFPDHEASLTADGTSFLLSQVGVTGRVLALLAAHPKPREAVGWILGLCGFSADHRRVLVNAVLRRSDADGSAKIAKSVGALPVVVTDSMGAVVGMGGMSLTARVVGEIRAAEGDVLALVRVRLETGVVSDDEEEDVVSVASGEAVLDDEEIVGHHVEQDVDTKEDAPSRRVAFVTDLSRVLESSSFEASRPSKSQPEDHPSEDHQPEDPERETAVEERGRLKRSRSRRAVGMLGEVDAPVQTLAAKTAPPRSNASPASSAIASVGSGGQEQESVAMIGERLPELGEEARQERRRAPAGAKPRGRRGSLITASAAPSNFVFVSCATNTPIHYQLETWLDVTSTCFGIVVCGANTEALSERLKKS